MDDEPFGSEPAGTIDNTSQLFILKVITQNDQLDADDDGEINQLSLSGSYMNRILQTSHAHLT